MKICESNSLLEVTSLQINKPLEMKNLRINKYLKINLRINKSLEINSQTKISPVITISTLFNIFKKVKN